MTEFNEQQPENGALVIGDMMARMFRPSGSPEADILETAGKFTFQLRLDQQLVLNRLAMVALHPSVPSAAKAAIETFIPMYTETKRHNESRDFITSIISAVSLKKFMDNKNINGQIIKTGQ